MKSTKLFRQPIANGTVISVVRIDGDAPTPYHEVARIEADRSITILERDYGTDDKGACALGERFALAEAGKEVAPIG